MAEQQQEQLQSRSTGKVLWFSGDRGFGFIKPDDDGSEDLFVHHSFIKSKGYRSLVNGASVEFTVSQGNNGKDQAVDVITIGGSPINIKDRRNGRGFTGGWRGGNDGRNGGGGCYNCGDLDHLARDCTNDAINHNNKDSYNNASNGSGTYCYNCQGEGHFARDCRKDNGGSAAGGGVVKCYSCGKFGHFARDCNRNSGGGGSKAGCFVCGGFGHLARDCDNSSVSKCFNCGEAGHFARECPDVKTSA